MFKINGMIWKVKFVHPNNPILFDNGNYTLGVCLNTNKTIYLADDLKGKC